MPDFQGVGFFQSMQLYFFFYTFEIGKGSSSPFRSTKLKCQQPYFSYKVCFSFYLSQILIIILSQSELQEEFIIQYSTVPKSSQRVIEICSLCILKSEVTNLTVPHHCITYIQQGLQHNYFLFFNLIIKHFFYDFITKYTRRGYSIHQSPSFLASEMYVVM